MEKKFIEAALPIEFYETETIDIGVATAAPLSEEEIAEFSDRICAILELELVNTDRFDGNGFCVRALKTVLLEAKDFTWVQEMVTECVNHVVSEHTVTFISLSFLGGLLQFRDYRMDGEPKKTRIDSKKTRKKLQKNVV